MLEIDYLSAPSFGQTGTHEHNEKTTNNYYCKKFREMNFVFESYA